MQCCFLYCLQRPFFCYSKPSKSELLVTQMLRRNMGVKHAPQRWQDNEEQFDVVVVFEERLMDNLLEGGNSCAIDNRTPHSMGT